MPSCCMLGRENQTYSLLSGRWRSALGKPGHCISVSSDKAADTKKYCLLVVLYNTVYKSFLLDSTSMQLAYRIFLMQNFIVHLKVKSLKLAVGPSSCLKINKETNCS